MTTAAEDLLGGRIPRPADRKPSPGGLQERVLAEAQAAEQITRRLRDEFAMAALPALIARHRADVPWTKIAPIAYRLADDMLEERSK